MTADRSTLMKLFLVRHGQDLDDSRFLINGRRDSPLTELGKRQALAAGDDLQMQQIGCVYTSPLQRAHETASLISQRLGIANVYVEAELIERDYGILTGRSPSEIPTFASRIFASNGFQYIIEAHGVENYERLWKRAGKVLRRIQRRHAGQNVLIVAHNEIIKMIRANFEKTSWEDELALPPVANCQVIALGP